MEIFIIAVVALIASLLTFFSGLGLGTILTPVLVIFFPVEVAIDIQGNLTVISVAVYSAFAGAYIGSKLLKNVTFNFIQWTTTIMIILLSIAIGTGLL